MNDFEEIFAQNYDIVYGYIMKRCADPHLAEEITQQAFFNAFLQIGRFRGDCKISVWICQIAKNELCAYYRKNRNKVAFPEELLCDDEEMFTKLENEEMKQLILSKIHCLQEPYREVFYLRILGDLSFREIGKIMEKNESWARVTYYRARMQIKEELS